MFDQTWNDFSLFTNYSYDHNDIVFYKIIIIKKYL